VVDFDDFFNDTGDSSSPSAGSVTKTSSNNVDTSDAASDEDTDPWAVLAAAAGEEALPPAQSHPEPQNIQMPPQDNPPMTSFAQGETFTMPQTQSPHQSGPIPIEGLATLGSQIQSHATNLSRTLSTKLKEVDAKHGIIQKVSDAKHNVEQKYHVSEKMNEFHTRVVKPTSHTVVEKVVPSVKQSWGVVSTTVRESVANLNTDNANGAGIDSVDGEVALNRQQTQVDIRQRWASISTAVGTKWNSAATTLGEKAEVWKEGHMQWREEHKKKIDEGHAKPLEDVKESLAGGMQWVSQRFRKKDQTNNDGSPRKEQSVFGTIIDMDSRYIDADKIPSSFLGD
jgi:DNA-binding HxlR family transcriptional regulator